MACVYTVKTKQSALSSALDGCDFTPVFMSGYVSPHVDINHVANTLRDKYPAAKILLCSSAGELCAQNSSDALYCSADQSWDNIVLQIFGADVIEQAEIVSIPLECEDLRAGRVDKDMNERVADMKAKLQDIQLPFDAHSHDTLAYILFDGLSGSESFLMDALYASDKFPCLFVGGSAGGKLDFKNTYIYDGTKVLENHASIAFLKMASNIRFGVFKSQNFEPTGVTFRVENGSTEFRYIDTVYDQSKQSQKSLIQALCGYFHCSPAELEGKMADYTFAIHTNKELYVRSVAQFDLEKERTHLYCDVSPGEELALVKRTSIINQTQRDFKAFMNEKPSKPIAGWLNDCILRRLCNGNDLGHMNGIFDDTPVVGFSTFGEILGLNLNQTLTAVFFFEVKDDQDFKDQYTDNFVFHYSNFKAFFLHRKLQGVSGLIDNLASHMNDNSHEQKHIVSDAMRVVQQAGDKVSDVIQSTEHMKEAGEDLKKIVDIIGGIAAQTNLLSLNATIEAARAGSYGAGFSVVADEVRQLAMRSKENSEQISKNLKEFSSNIDNITREIEDQSQLVSGLHEFFQRIDEHALTAEQTADSAKSMADYLREVAHSKN